MPHGTPRHNTPRRARPLISASLGVFLDGLDMPIGRTPSMCHFKLSLVAPDPNIYDNSAGGALTASLSRQSAGGVTWPITWPITWTGAGAPTVIANSGNIVVYPTVTLTGVMTNPTITNSTVGQFFTLQGLTTVAGDVVVIDMLNRTVLLNGGSVLPYMTSASNWLPLLPGNNSMILSTTGSSDTVTGTLSWQAAYRGI